MKYLHWLHLGFAMLSALTGCSTFTRGPELERARAAVAVAYAEVTTGVTSWQGDLPLIGPSVESDEPANSAAADADESTDVKGGADSQDADGAARAIAWQTDFPAAVELSRETDKPLWIHVVHDGCGPCESLKPFFRDPRFVERVNRQLVAVQVDRFKGAGPAVVTAFKAGGLDPVDLFVFPSGKYLRYPGAPPSVAAYLNRFESFPGYAAQAKWPGYVTASNAGKWKLSGETVDVNHLMTHANHRDKFSDQWLRSLNRRQLLTLHDHDHDNTVRWEFVPTN